MISEILKKFILNINFNDGNNYCIPYDVFLNPYDEFMDFCCEQSIGKKIYLKALNRIQLEDNHAIIMAIVYDKEDNYIYSNDICIITSLSKKRINEIFNKVSIAYNKYIDPSEIAEIFDADILKTYYEILFNDNHIDFKIIYSIYETKKMYILSWD